MNYHGYMKTIFAFALLVSTLTAFAATDYVCSVRTVKLELKSDSDSSTLIIRDAQTNEFLYNGIVSEIIKSHGESDLMFETQRGSFLQLRFKTDALEANNETLFGLVRGWTGHQFLDSSLKCHKKEVPTIQ
jgi:hypothetical protein